MSFTIESKRLPEGFKGGTFKVSHIKNDRAYITLTPDDVVAIPLDKFAINPKIGTKIKLDDNGTVTAIINPKLKPKGEGGSGCLHSKHNYF